MSSKASDATSSTPKRAADAWRGVWRVLSAFGWWGLLAWPAALFCLGDLYLVEADRIADWRPGEVTRAGRDFVNVWEGGRLTLAGESEIIYDRPAYRDALLDDAGVRGGYAFSYPPHVLAFTAPFGLFAYPVALALWTLIGMFLFWHAARPWLRDVGLPGWAALILPAGFINIWAGHFGFLIGALALYGWRHSLDQPKSAGFTFALMTIKPHLGLLVPPILLARGRWTAAVWAALGALLLFAVSLLVAGWDAWLTYVTSTLPYQARIAENPNPLAAYFPMMPTVGHAMRMISGSEAWVVFGVAAAAIATLAILLWAYLRAVPVRELGLLSIFAVFALLPYSFTYDMVAISLVALVLAQRWKSELWFWEKIVLAFVFIAAAVHAPLARLGIPSTPFFLIAAQFIAARRMIIDAAARETAA